MPASGRYMKDDEADMEDDLRPHYDFDYGKMKPNRFAGRDLIFKGNRAVILDEDVAEAFESQEEVNAVLRAAIEIRDAGSRSVPRRPKSPSPKKAAKKGAGGKRSSTKKSLSGGLSRKSGKKKTTAS